MKRSAVALCRAAIALSFLAILPLTVAFGQAAVAPPPHNDHDGHDHGPTKPRPAPVRRTIVAKPPTPKLPAGVLMRVNGRDLTGDEVIRHLASFGGQPLAKELAQSIALEQEAKKLGVVVPDADIRKGVQEAKDQFVQAQMQKGVVMPYSEIAARDGITDGLLWWSVRRNLLAQKAFAKQVERQLPKLDGQVKIAHIVLLTLPTAPAVGENPKPMTTEEQKKRDDDANAKLVQIQDEIKAGKITFEAAARQHSQDTETKEKGGEIQWTTPAQLNNFAPEFARAALSLQKAGDMVGPLKTQYGYHLVKLVRRGKDATKIERETYAEEWMRQAKIPALAQKWFQELIERTVIVRNPNPKTAFAVKPTAAPIKTASPTKKSVPANTSAAGAIGRSKVSSAR